MQLSGLDTMIVIYAMKRCGNSASADELELRKRTLVLLDNLRKEKATIVLPSVAVHEVLNGYPKERHGRVLATINERFFVAHLDLAAAALASEIWIQHKGLPPEKKLERKLLKIDTLVVATAKIGGASTFYSHDAKCRTLASLAGLVARDLPTHSTDLLLEAELKHGDVDSGLEQED